MLLITHLLEKVFLLKHESKKIINYENVELIKPENRAELIRDLEDRTGLDNQQGGNWQDRLFKGFSQDIYLLF